MHAENPSNNHHPPVHFLTPSLPPQRPTTPLLYIIRKCITILQSCASSTPKLRQIHAFSIRRGVPITNPQFNKHLIYTLVSLSSPMAYTHTIFSQTQNPNVFTWNTMIRGYAETDNPKPALELYSQMRGNYIEPDTHTYPFLLKAVSKSGNVRVGEKIHSVAVRNGLESLLFVQNGLVYMYGVCGRYDSAYKVFDVMPERDLVSWNSIINGFAHNGRPNDTLALFEEMRVEGVEPDGFTMVSLLCASSELGDLALGRRAHVYMVKVGLDTNLHARNALLDLYAKCGSVGDARKVFDEAGEKNVVSWTCLIVGLAVNGFGKDAIGCFERMEEEGLVPREIAFVGVLNACSQCGMLSEGFSYFKRMEEYGIVPMIEHYGCIVDLLGRAGLVNEAYRYIQDMPMKPNAPVWRTLLGACNIHGHLALGEVARAKLLELEPEDGGDYVLLSNLYATEQRWSDVHRVRKTMSNEQVKKTQGIAL